MLKPILLFFSRSLSKDFVWSFGGGPRACAGRSLSTIILKVCVCVFEDVGGVLCTKGTGFPGKL